MPVGKDAMGDRLPARPVPPGVPSLHRQRTFFRHMPIFGKKIDRRKKCNLDITLRPIRVNGGHHRTTI
jgi:hypothetical protein